MVVKGLFAFLLLIVVAGGVVYVLAQQKPFAARALAPVAVSAQAARSFDDKVQVVRNALDEAKRTGAPVAITLTLDEAELTSKASEATAQLAAGLAASDIQVHLAGGDLIATSKVTVQGIGLDLGVVATPVVENGQAKILIKEIQTGAIALPEDARRQIEAQVGKAFDPQALGLTFDISSITIVDGKLVILGTAKP